MKGDMKAEKNIQKKYFMQIFDELKKEPYLWDLFTRREEYDPIKLDKYGRFSISFSNYKNISVPQVSEYLVKKRQMNIEYPENKKFAVLLTHDIDDINISSKHIVRSLFPFPPNRDFFGFKSIFSERLKGKRSCYKNFNKIIELEQRYNAKSSFYFLANNKDIFGYKYKIEEVQDDICYIIDNDCEVGLHTSYYAFDKLDGIIKEKEKIEKITGKKVKGVRNHLLMFNIPNSWEILSKAGFTYDSTLGYHDIIGFRNGMCHPFKPYNINSNKEIDIIEIPLCISDLALFSYMKKNAMESWELVKKLIDTTQKLGGVLAILWHNWTFSYPVSFGGLFGKEWTRLYEKILNYCNNRDAWLTNGKEIADFFK